MTRGAGDGKRAFDLEERTARFGEAVIDFAKKVRINEITERLVPQVVAAATSVGANYCEADEAESKKDFRHKICIAKKEARESKHYIRMLVRAQPDLKPAATPLWQEGKELTLIFASIVRRCDGEEEQ
ncbi:MAG: four helix bundle protein [Planctomycetes bacterium]|nr:four helix bundle protein [Planctomycetota bacterium]